MYNVGGGESALFALSFTPSSDVRLKKNICSLDCSLSKVIQLQGVKFFWKTDQKETDPQLGLIAQDVEKIYPEAVKLGENGYYGINYNGLVGPLIEAIKELNAKNEVEQQQIENLKSENKNLKINSELRISKLESFVEKLAKQNDLEVKK